ncbi:hypothetical protein [Candidatus Palauibacter sp.]
MSRGANAPREFLFDVLVAGEPARRQVPVACSPSGLWFDGEQVELDSIFWVSRRAGLILLFSRRHTLAFFGDGGDLQELARAVERGTSGDTRRSILQPLASEVVVCAAGTAVTGEIAGEPVNGLYLAVFTRQGLHLFAGEGKHRVRWPVECAEGATVSTGGASRPGLHLAAGDTSVTIRYLFPEEIQAVLRVARKTPAPPDPGGALEMFAKGEVTRPLPARLPEFSEAADTLRSACDTAVERVRIDASIGERFDRVYFQRHFQALGEIALGPLMLRRSAALKAGSLMSAVEAMDAEQMRQDAIAAFRGVAEELARVYGNEVRHLVRAKRLDREHGERAFAQMDGPSLWEAMSRRIETLDPVFDAVLARQQLLWQRLHARDLAPPETEEAGVEEAIVAWNEEVTRLDAAYGAAGGEVLMEIAARWSDRLIPALRGLTALRGRRLSDGSRLTILAIVTFFVVAALAWLARGLL